MSGSKKKTYNDPYGSAKANDTFGAIFKSLRKNEKFKKLSSGTRDFYTLCRVQAKSSEGLSCLTKHGEETGQKYLERHFVFPAKHLEVYGVKRQNAKRYFEELINAGFIDKIEQNNHRQKVNVYAFSDRWRNGK